MKARPGSDNGSATVLVVAVGMFLSAVAMAVGLVATGLTAHRQAVRAADLAALAGAQQSLSDHRVACTTAAEVAVRNGAVLRSCRLEAATLVVEVTIATVDVLPPIVAAARAGQRVS